MTNASTRACPRRSARPPIVEHRPRWSFRLAADRSWTPGSHTGIDDCMAHGAITGSRRGPFVFGYDPNAFFDPWLFTANESREQDAQSGCVVHRTASKRAADLDSWHHG